MTIFYRSLFILFIAASSLFSSQRLHAQLSEEQREQLREQNRDLRQKNLAQNPRQQSQITKSTIPLPAPRIVNFTERANWQLAHPTDKTKRIIEQGEQADGYIFKPWPVEPDAKVSPIPGSKNGTAGNNEKASVNSPAPLLSFTGVASDNITIPPDINAAAGITYVMETTNQQFGIFNKSNGSQVANVSLNNFCKNETTDTTTTGYYDPHILYDALHGRFLGVVDATLTNGDGGLFLVISQTSDPTGNWYVYTIDGGVSQNATGSPNLLDFPEMGYNENWVVLTANQFTSTTTSAEIYIMNRASLYSGTQGTITHFSDAGSFCISASQTMDTTTLTEYLVQNSNGNSGGNGYVKVGTITGAVGSPTYSAGTQLGIAQTWNDNAVKAPQMGTTALIDNDDPRIFASEYINGSLWFAHTVWLPATGTATSSAADWWQINPAALTVQQFGRISAASTWYYYPNIYANANGDAIISYGVSSSSEYASAIYSFHAASDPVNTMENLYTYKSGISGYQPTGFGNDYRWGDFNGVSIDPNDSSFWVSGEWADNNNLWSTQIAHVGTSAPNTNPPIVNFQANVTSSCTGVIHFTDLSGNNPTSWLWNFGDGSTSTTQNPLHTYLSNGTFTVTLTATNTYGNNTQTLSAYITINETPAPAAVGASHCGPGSFSLSATTSNPVKWYDSTGTLVSTSNPFVTQVLNQTTTYYVQDSTVTPADSAGPLSNTSVGTGGYLNTAYGLNFDVLQPGTLQSVYVYAQTAGSITITITNSGGTQVNSATVNVPAGGSRVALNFPLAVGTGYLISWSGATALKLYRNNAGAAYPYADANGIVSITGNNAGTVPLYYYFFYNWYVSGPGCNSQSAAVTATVTQGINTSNVTITNVECNGENTGSVVLTPSGGTPSYTYNWSNGQTTNTLSAVAAGTYTVTVTDINNCSGVASEVVSQPAQIAFTASSTETIHGQSTGSASVSNITGGVAPYVVSWSNNQTGNSISGLSMGTYSVTVTDHNGCDVTDSVVVNNLVGITPINKDLSFTIYPNPAKSEVTIDAGTVNKQTTLLLEDELGHILLSKEVTTSPVNIDLYGYANGVYFIELTQGSKRAVKKFVIDR